MFFSKLYNIFNSQQKGLPSFVISLLFFVLQRSSCLFNAVTLRQYCRWQKSKSMDMILVCQFLSATNWYYPRVVLLWFRCIVCVDCSRYLICIYSNILINVVDWVQCQHFQLSHVIPMLNFIINIISIFFRIFCSTIFGSMYWFWFCSLINNGFIRLNEWIIAVW